MRALRYPYLFTLIVWIGGMVTWGARNASGVRDLGSLRSGNGTLPAGRAVPSRGASPVPHLSCHSHAKLRVRRIAAHLLGLLAIEVRNGARTVLGAGAYPRRSWTVVFRNSGP